MIMALRRHTRVGLGGVRGFTLVELLVAMAIIGILAAIAIQQFESLSAKSRITRARSDAKTIGTAVSVFTAHMGVLPSVLTDLTVPATNTDGITAGPFLSTVPSPPGAAWTPYSFAPQPNGTFQISATGDGIIVTWP